MVRIEVAAMKFRVKKKYIMLILSAALIALTAYTLAYFTSSDNVTNRFSGKTKKQM